jgi:hypothetical protein
LMCSTPFLSPFSSCFLEHAFYFFLHSLYPFFLMMITLERGVMKQHGVLILWMNGWSAWYLLVYKLSMWWRCVRDLDHESMKCISQRVTTIWQNSMR